MVTAASRTLYAEYGSWPTLLYLLRIPRGWGTANELKMKYFADNEFRHLQGEELNKAIREKIRQKDEKKTSLVGNMQAEGTTPRRLTDLLGSLSDLTSGSGDRGTPVVLIKGYFQNYASE